MCLSLLNDKYLGSSSTLIGPLEPSHAPLARGRSQAHLENFSFFTSLSTAEEHVCGVKFIGLYGTVGFIAIRDFSY